MTISNITSVCASVGVIVVYTISLKNGLHLSSLLQFLIIATMISVVLLFFVFCNIYQSNNENCFDIESTSFTYIGKGNCLKSKN